MIKKTITVIASLIIVLSSDSVIAHGEDKPGPNGGFIRMPGAFHTELILETKNRLKVFLLNMEWKNPSVVKSNVHILHNNKSKAECKISENSYICIFPKTVDLTKKGSLKVMATRENQKGNEVSYSLPFKLKVVDDGHGGHH